MTSPPAPPGSSARSRPDHGRIRLRWWREVLYIVAFYGVYSLVRNRGLEQDVAEQAFTNAERVIRVQEFLHSFHEEWIQSLFYPRWEWFIWFWNVFYGTAHFIVTAAALVWLFRRQPWRYPLWRNTLAFTTALALIGFAFFPLMPPRLLNDCSELGACAVQYGFVDTLREVGGLWSFDNETMQQVSNQYAAMPSLHFGWSTWSALVLLPLVRRRWAKALVVSYPFLTLFAIVVTANHFWLDAAGGALVLAVGYLLARPFTNAWSRWAARRDSPSAAVDLAHADGFGHPLESPPAGPAEHEATRGRGGPSGGGTEG